MRFFTLHPGQYTQSAAAFRRHQLNFTGHSHTPTVRASIQLKRRSSDQLIFPDAPPEPWAVVNPERVPGEMLLEFGEVLYDIGEMRRLRWCATAGEAQTTGYLLQLANAGDRQSMYELRPVEGQDRRMTTLLGRLDQPNALASGFLEPLSTWIVCEGAELLLTRAPGKVAGGSVRSLGRGFPFLRLTFLAGEVHLGLADGAPEALERCGAVPA